MPQESKDQSVYYNPKEFRSGYKVSASRKAYSGVTLVWACMLSGCFVFIVTMLILAIEPEALAGSYDLALRIADLLPEIQITN